MERDVQPLLRKSEHCSHAVELCRMKPSGQKRLRVVAVITSVEYGDESRSDIFFSMNEMDALGNVDCSYLFIRMIIKL